MGQGDIHQQAEWLLKAWNGDIIGTYAQVRKSIQIDLYLFDWSIIFSDGIGTRNIY